MKVDTFKTLLADLCREVGIDVAALDADRRLFVDGTDISLAHEAGAGAGHLWICVDFGAIPEERASRFYRTMLQSNLRAGGLQVGAFTLQPTGRVAWVVRQPITAELTGRRLAQALLQYGAAAKGWIAEACNSTESEDAP